VDLNCARMSTVTDHVVYCAEMGIHDLRGRAISLRWLEHNQLSGRWSPAHYTWLCVVLFTVAVIVITLVLKYRHTVCLSDDRALQSAEELTLEAIVKAISHAIVTHWMDSFHYFTGVY